MSRFQYDEEQMKKALDDVKNGMSLNLAAKIHGVPRMTLSDKHKGKSPSVRKMGPSAVLTRDEESHLVKWILHLSDMGFPVNKEHLLDSVQMLLKEMGRPTPFTHGKPGRHWYEGFRKRNPVLTERVSQNLTRTRAGVTEKNIRNWFEEIASHFEEKNLTEVVAHCPERVFNCDETAFFLSPGTNKVIVRKGQKVVHNIVNSDEKECITTLIMGNAAGALAPPMVVISLKRVPKTFADSVPASWAVGKSENGWMTGQTFYEYIANVFYPWLIENKIEFPIVLYLDGHVSHLTLALSKFCSDKQIELVALYPNSTHFLQPMDVAVFHPLKNAWKKEVFQWRIKNSGARLKRDNFCPLLKKVLDSTIKAPTLQNGFRACGLFPMNPDAITYFKRKESGKDDGNEGQEKTERNEDDQMSKLRTHLNFLESKIGEDKLGAFRDSGDLWLGNIEDTNLFHLWRGIRTELESPNTENLMQIAENHINLDNLLEHNDVLIFEVDEYGTLNELPAESVSKGENSHASVTGDDVVETIDTNGLDVVVNENVLASKQSKQYLHVLLLL